MDVSEQAASLHRDAFVCDFTLPYTDLGAPGLKRALLPRFAASGVDFVSLSIGGDGFDAGTTIKKIAVERAQIQASPDLYRLVDTADDMLAAKRAGRVGIAFDLQGTSGLDGSLAMIEVLYILGVRHMLMAYNLRNSVGDGCMEPSDAGLSGYGRRVVAEMNRVGMLVDVAHTGRQTALDTIAASTSPVIVSHGNAAAVHSHPRNVDDTLIAAVAKSGGVIGVLGISNMVNAQYDVSAARLVEHIDHMVQMVGPDHVGLSLDYVYDQSFIYEAALAAAGGAFPPGSGYRPDMPLAEPEDYPRITQAMIDRGYDETSIRKILGLNWYRVAKAVWRPAGGDASDIK